MKMPETDRQDHSLSDQRQEQEFTKESCDAARFFVLKTLLKPIFHPQLQGSGKKSQTEGRQKRKLKAQIPGRCGLISTIKTR